MKLAIFCPNWVGDAVMATPALRALRRQFPTANFLGLMRPVIDATLAGSGWFDDVVPYDPRGRDRRQRMTRVIAALRAYGPDLAVLFTNDFRGALVAFLAGAKRRVGYARELRGVLLTERLHARRGLWGYTPSPIVDYYLGLAYHLGAERESPRLELAVSVGDEARSGRILERFGVAEEDRLVVLNPGAAFGPAKQWPAAYFSDLARRLADEMWAKVLVLCGPGERELASRIAFDADRPGAVHSLAEEEVSIGLSKAMVRRASLLVSTDSGPRHFAAAFGVPVVSLFGPTHAEWTETYYPGEVKLQRKLPCGPCQRRTCPLGHHRCMTELSVPEVFSAARRLLEDVPVNPRRRAS